MKKVYLIILFIIACIIPLSAHDKPDKDRAKMMKEVQEFKMKYLAQEMDLKGEQQKKFFELYSEMNEKRAACYKTVRKIEKKIKDKDDATEEDYQEATEAMRKANEESAEIEKAYDEKFSEFLSQKQLYKMKEAEQEFRKKMEEMRHNKRGPHKMKPPTK